jgi:transposase
MGTQYQLLPNLSEKEYENLKADIAERGIQVPIELDEHGNILDGHHRLKACEELGIKDYPSIVRVGMSEEEKTHHILTLNLARRHLNQEQKIALWKKLRKQGLTYEKIAERVNGSITTIQRNISPFSNEKGDQPERITGKDGKSYPSIFNKNRREERRSLDTLTNLPIENLPNKILDVKRVERLEREYKADERRKTNTETEANIGTCKLILGDFRKVGNEIADECVDLIFTDPPYPEEYLPLWHDLAAFAARVLKKSGMLIAYTGAMYLPEVIGGLSEHLCYWWAGSIILPGAHSRIYARNIVQGSKPLLFYVRNDYTKGDIWLEDTFSSEGESKDNHDWEQSIGMAIYYINKYTQPNGLVVDTFMGSGTTGLAAKYCDRNFVGFEIDASHFMTSKERIENG